MTSIHRRVLHGCSDESPLSSAAAAAVPGRNSSPPAKMDRRSRLIPRMLRRHDARLKLLTSVLAVLCLLSLGALPGIDGQQLVISPRGTQVKTANSGIMFTCTVTGIQDGDAQTVEMRWQGPDMEYISSTKGSRVYVERVDQHGLRLYITKVEESDAGVYVCKARLGSNGDTIHEETRMFLYEDIRFANTPTTLRHAIGSSPLLECIATGQPPPEMSWRFNRKKISPDNEKYRFEERGLRIEKLDLRDNGTYECRAEVSSHGNLKIRTITVDVLYPPVIRREPTPGVFVKDRPAELSCEADGNPPITYEWFKEKHMSGSIRVRMKLHNQGGSYVIRKVDLDDEGQYICRVSNSLGTKELNVSVTVIVHPRVDDLSPKMALEGRTVELQCAATGDPVPQLGWKRADIPCNYTEGIQQNDGRIMVDSSQPGRGKLIIQAVNRNDSGLYTCLATNIAGTDSKNVSLSVEFLPTVSIADSETELIGWAREQRNVTCECRGLPLPTVNWLYRGGQQINDNDVFTVVTTRTASSIISRLQITLNEDQLSLYGNYTCIAKNPHGYMSKDVRLRQAQVPDTPTNVSVLEEAATWVRLSAEAPRRDGGMPVNRWYVRYEIANVPATGQSTSTMFLQSVNMTVNGLSPGVDYTFYLSAENEVGVGLPIKFRVRTPRRASYKEQSDLPRRPTDELSTRHNNNSFFQFDDGLAEKDQPRDAVRGVIEQSHVTRGGGAKGDGTGGQGFGVVFLGVTVGVATVLAALLVAVVVCFVSTSRNRRQKEQAAAGSNGRRHLEQNGTAPPNTAAELETFHNINGSIPQTATLGRSGSLHPQPPTRKSSRASNNIVQSPAGSYMSSPKPSRIDCNGGLPAPNMAPTKSAGPTSSFQVVPPPVAPPVDCVIQRHAWESMLQRQVDVGNEERPLSMSELPPPPDFLLENGSSSGPGVTGVDLLYDAGSRVAAGRHAMDASPLLFEIADGYRSGDSVDDDIDDVDYTIRAPSVHGHLYG